MISSVSKLVDVGFGSITFVREHGTETYFVLKLEDDNGEFHTYILGEPEEFNEEKMDPLDNLLTEFMRGTGAYKDG